MSPKDGKRYLTDVATQPQLFRIIQSIPSKKAEPFKQWMAQVASDRLDQKQNPELNFEQAFADFRRLGYSERWINQRLQTIRAHKELMTIYLLPTVLRFPRMTRRMKNNRKKVLIPITVILNLLIVHP